MLGLLPGEDRFILRVTDFGEAIDPAKIEPRNLDELKPGGLGIYFMRELMDSTDFGPSPDGVGNVLQMTKRKGSARW